MKDVFFVKNDTYGVFVYLAICPRDELLQYVTKPPIRLRLSPDELHIGTNVAGYTVELSDKFGGDSYLIWISDFQDTVEDYVYLAHEVSHAAFFILQNRGWKDFNSSDSQHSQMYLKDMLYKSLLTKIRAKLK